MNEEDIHLLLLVKKRLRHYEKRNPQDSEKDVKTHEKLVESVFGVVGRRQVTVDMLNRNLSLFEVFSLDFFLFIIAPLSCALGTVNTKSNEAKAGPINITRRNWQK